VSILGRFLRSLFAPSATGPGAKLINDLCNSGRFDEAERLLRESLRTRHAPHAARMLGAVCAMQHRYQEAIDVLRAAQDRSRPDPDAANLIGVCHSLLGQYSEAILSYDEATRADANQTDAYLNGGFTAFLLGRADDKQRFHQWLALRKRSHPGAPATRNRKLLELPSVTLCCVDCAYHEMAAEALRASLSACVFGDALFLSDRDCLVPGVRFAKIAPVKSMAAYSNFMIHELHGHIRTDFALITQYDGFVLNPDAWDPAFLDYDYIGAPTRVGDKLVVGNGGFSLRSRKLLHALRDDAQIRSYDAARGTRFEDTVICGGFRQRLETVHGIRFAPADVAERFSAGRTMPTRRSFGFHGLALLVRLHEEGFEMRDTAEDGISIVFRARTELGTIAAHRQIELSSRAEIWNN